MYNRTKKTITRILKQGSEHVWPTVASKITGEESQQLNRWVQENARVTDSDLVRKYWGQYEVWIL